jgi:hypothetical protein
MWTASHFQRSVLVHASRLSPMLEGASFATTIAALSLVVATASVGWNIAAWRRAGPLLRVHALLYEEALVIRIFNAGRTSEAIECAVLGGVRHGRRGIDISEALRLPRTLGPSESLHEQLHWKDLVPLKRQTLLRSGWESVWLLRGSMQEQRVEVLPIAGRRPPTIGWDLAPSRSNQNRYVPLIMAVPFVTIGADAATHTSPVWISFAIVVPVVMYRIHTAVVRGRPPRRRQAENWTVVVGALVTITLWTARADFQWMWVGYAAWAVVLATPGAVSAITIDVRSAIDRWQTRRGARAEKAQA